jgi:GT2 family glycosyltransferase
VLIVDQSPTLISDPVVRASGLQGARVVACFGHGRGLAVDKGLEAASHPTVFVVDDDCTVRDDWIGVGCEAMSESPGGIITGQVLPGAGGGQRAVPSTLIDTTPHDYTGELHCHVLYAGNMVCSRDAVLELGGFDPRIVPAAEDCDLCFRWLKAGRQLRHVPELVIWHNDWRSPAELERHYVGYYRGQGRFYAKHLRAGELRVLRFMIRDFHGMARSAAAWLLRGTPRWSDFRRGALPGLLQGLWWGWREFGG